MLKVGIENLLCSGHCRDSVLACSSKLKRLWALLIMLNKKRAAACAGGRRQGDWLGCAFACSKNRLTFF